MHFRQLSLVSGLKLMEVKAATCSPPLLFWPSNLQALKTKYLAIYYIILNLKVSFAFWGRIPLQSTTFRGFPTRRQQVAICDTRQRSPMKSGSHGTMTNIMGSIMKCIMQTLWNLEHDGFGTKNIFDLLKVFDFIPQMVVKHGDLPWLNP